jgi:filamentous hemagglutinin family protein
MFATTAAAHGGASRAVRSASVAQIASVGSGTLTRLRGLLQAFAGPAGDLFIIQKNGISHTGVVDFVKNGVIHTIEGNTSSGAVSKGTRSPGELSGVARPKYHR